MTDTILVQQRAVTGSNVAKLRREGVLPATVYGRGLPAVTVQMPYADARDLMNDRGLNTLFQLSVEGESETRPVVVRQMSQHPVTRRLEHLEFYQVDLARPIESDVIVELTGEAPAVSRFGGMVVQVVETLKVSALPGDLPERLDVPLQALSTLESKMSVRDLVPPHGVTILSNPSQLVVQIARTRASASAAATAAPAAAAAPARKK